MERTTPPPPGAGLNGSPLVGLLAQLALADAAAEIDGHGGPLLVALQKNGNKIDDPKRFEGTAFYPGAILLVGEIVK